MAGKTGEPGGMAETVKASLRLRPDDLVVGESRTDLDAQGLLDSLGEGQAATIHPPEGFVYPPVITEFLERELWKDDAD